MAARFTLNHGLRVASALAFLVLITSAPLRPLKCHAGSVQFVIAQPGAQKTLPHGGDSSRFSAAAPSLRPVLVKAVASETEEDALAAIADSTSRLLLVPHAAPIGPSITKAARRDIQSLCPLRC